MIVKQLGALRRLVLLFACLGIIWALLSPYSSAIGLVVTEPQAAQPGPPASAGAQEQTQTRNPAAWGGNHAGKPVPDYVHGDECLFCHRNDIGSGWQKNSHGITLRQSEDAPELQRVLESESALKPVAAEIGYFLGSRHRVRFLKKAGYGRFAILSTQAVLGPDKRAVRWIGLTKPTWDADRFANQCAGCHTTGVDSKTKAFSAFGLDCYTCHGNVNLEHTNDTSLIFLSKKSRKDPRAVESTCAACHLRIAKARSTGLPYPNNFIPGDNLFQDYDVDFSKADDPNLNPGDRHVLRNVRDVAVYGLEFPTCITCHQVHANSSEKHHRAPRSAICSECHNENDNYKAVKAFTVNSALCEY